MGVQTTSRLHSINVNKTQLQYKITETKNDDKTEGSSTIVTTSI